MGPETDTPRPPASHCPCSCRWSGTSYFWHPSVSTHCLGNQPSGPSTPVDSRRPKSQCSSLWLTKSCSSLPKLRWLSPTEGPVQAAPQPKRTRRPHQWRHKQQWQPLQPPVGPSYARFAGTTRLRLSLYAFWASCSVLRSKWPLPSFTFGQHPSDLAPRAQNQRKRLPPMASRQLRCAPRSYGKAKGTSPAALRRTSALSTTSSSTMVMFPAREKCRSHAKEPTRMAMTSEAIQLTKEQIERSCSNNLQKLLFFCL
mmetsp:Transcript_37055/g.105945  ORF Transcript_37055/g.105945 Transcript_37055/m.105945 type:complete len:256 (-) Transcript_37055:648-1415(-)